MSAYDRVVFHGKTVNKRTRAMLLEAERRLGYELTVVQGSYNAGGVSASAGTHDGGGAVDLAPYDWQLKVRVLRAIGFAAWYRPAIPGLWGSHIHAIAIGDNDLSSGARNQVSAYYAGRNGLANNAADPHARPNPIPVFVYKADLPKIDVQVVRNQFTTKNPAYRWSVKKVQEALNKKNNAGLAVDGEAGPQTKAAYEAWEKKLAYNSKRLVPNRYTLKALGRLMFGLKKK